MTRPRESYVSDDPERRAAQLANLPNLRGKPTSTTWQEGDAPNLSHGARSEQPQGSADWSPAVMAAVYDLSARVGEELRGEDGELAAWALPSVEAVALQRVQAMRVERYLAAREAKGSLKPADITDSCDAITGVDAEGKKQLDDCLGACEAP